MYNPYRKINGDNMAGREDDFPKRGLRFFKIPERETRIATINREFEIAKSRFPVVYGDEQFAKPGTLPDLAALLYAFDMIRTRNPNLVEPTMFLGAWEIEREAITMLADLFHHPNFRDEQYNPANDAILGWFTDGGTSSILQAAWSLRNKFFIDLEAKLDSSFDMTKQRGTLRNKGIGGLIAKGMIDADKLPVILAPVDMHFAADKSIDILGLGSDNIVRYHLNKDFSTDHADLAQQVQKISMQGKEIMFVFSTAGTVNTGRVEDVQKLSDTLKEAGCNAPIIVDAAQQYMMLSMLKDNYPIWDFRADAVEAIIADPHKTDQSTYPGSVVIFKDKSIVPYTRNSAGYLHNDDSVGYDMKSIWKLMPQIHTSRSVIGPLCTWAYFILHGNKKITEKYADMWRLTQKLSEYIKESEFFELLCRPQTGIVPFHLRDFDDAKASQVYHEFEMSRKNPRFYISNPDDSRVKTKDDFRDYSRKKEHNFGRKINGYGGLYIQIMHHATDDLVNKLIDRLDVIGYSIMRKKFYQVL